MGRMSSNSILIRRLESIDKELKDMNKKLEAK
jgi:hypothetical protein